MLPAFPSNRPVDSSKVQVGFCFGQTDSKLRIQRTAREGNHIADIRHPRHKLHQPLKP